MEGIEKSVHKIGVLRDIALLRVSGYVDTTTSPELQKAIAQEINEGTNQFIVDLGGVHYVSSAGWGVFVGEIRGLRENGGDLKITQMTPEVNEVFEMLEFNRILTCYDSLEEAVDDFDFCRGLKINTGANGSLNISEDEDTEKLDKGLAKKMPDRYEKNQIVKKSAFPKRSPNVDLAVLPLTEKIKNIIIDNPIISVLGIKRLLNSEKYGFTKSGYFKLRGILKKMGLDTKAKRYRYYRSR